MINPSTSGRQLPQSSCTQPRVTVNDDANQCCKYDGKRRRRFGDSKVDVNLVKWYYFTVVQTDNVEAVSHHQNQMVSRDGDLVTPGSPHDGCGTVSTIKMFITILI